MNLMDGYHHWSLVNIFFYFFVWKAIIIFLFIWLYFCLLVYPSFDCDAWAVWANPKNIKKLWTELKCYHSADLKLSSNEKVYHNITATIMETRERRKGQFTFHKFLNHKYKQIHSNYSCIKKKNSDVNVSLVIIDCCNSWRPSIHTEHVSAKFVSGTLAAVEHITVRSVVFLLSTNSRCWIWLIRGVYSSSGILSRKAGGDAYFFLPILLLQ
jgi:hypothetical protein